MVRHFHASLAFSTQDLVQVEASLEATKEKAIKKLKFFKNLKNLPFLTFILKREIP